MKVAYGVMSGAVMVMVLGLGVELASAQGWYDQNWTYRKAITIAHGQVEAGLDNFPVLVYGAGDAGLQAHAQASGNDLVFTAADGTTKLPREIEHFDPATGNLWCWVRVPHLSATEDTIFYLYYGNSAAAETNDPQTWDADYIMVQHLKETSGHAMDSTANGNNSMYEWTAQQGRDGLLFKGVAFDMNTREDLRVAYNPTLNCDSVTVEFWHNFSSDNSFYTSCFLGRHRAFDDDNTPWLFPAEYAGGHYEFRASTTGGGGSRRFISTTSVVKNANTYAVAKYDASIHTVSMLVNNNQILSDSSSTGTLVHSDHSLLIGNLQDYDTGAPYAEPWSPKGMMDEVRISRVARSDAWLRTGYHNQNNPTAFLAFGSEELYTVPDTATPTDTPTDTATATPTDTPSSTPSSTPSDTPSATPTDTPSSTPSDTPSATPTDTPTATPSATPSSTPSDTPTVTPTDTVPPTPTRTRNELGIAAPRWEALP